MQRVPVRRVLAALRPRGTGATAGAGRRPSIGPEGSPSRPRKSAILTNAIGCLVLAVTALLATGRLAGAAEISLADILWGASPADIVAFEGEEPAADLHDYLLYRLDGCDCSGFKIYYFSESELYQVFYVIKPSEGYVVGYYRLDEQISGLLGFPIYEERQWSSEFARLLFEDNMRWWGLAIRLGQLRIETIWRNGDTGVAHLLHSKNFSIEHYIMQYDLTHRSD